jgi:hypothetical protein
MDSLHRYSFALCVVAGLVCAFVSAYLFVNASYNYVVLALVLCGFALALEMVGAIISRDRAEGSENGGPSVPDLNPGRPQDKNGADV